MDQDGRAAFLLRALRYFGTKAYEVARYPFAETQRIYWLYVLTSLVIAFGIYLLARQRGDSRDSLLSFLLPRKVYTHPSAVVDYKFFIINRFLFSALIAPMLLASATISDAVSAVMTRVFDPQVATTVGWPTQLLFTACLWVGCDLATYAAHYLQHRVPILWEFHKTHHSAEVLTPITVYRMHPLDDILGVTFFAAAAGASDGAFRAFYGNALSPMLVMNLNVFLFTFYLLGYHLRHSHIWLSYPGWLSRLLISPAQHQIHHSKAPRHYDKNFGFMFACWDWMFGTLYVPKGHEQIEYGLSNDEHLEMNSVWQLYMRPFRMVYGMLFPTRSRAT